MSPISDAALVKLLGDLADAVVICEPSGTIVFWNGAATRMFGWQADEVMGCSLDVIIPERQRDRHWRGWERVMQTGHTDYGDRLLEVPALHRDGRRMSIAFTVSLLTTPGKDAPDGIAAVIRDDTERWQERRDLKARVTALETGGATVSA